MSCDNLMPIRCIYGGCLQDEVIKSLQKHLDIDGDGKIDKDELEKLKHLRKGIEEHG